MTDKPKWSDLFGIDPDYTKDAVEEPTLTAAEVKVLTEAALRLGRKEAGEEIAAAIEGLSRHDYQYDEFDVGTIASAKVAREIASKLTGEVGA